MCRSRGDHIAGLISVVVFNVVVTLKSQIVQEHLSRGMKSQYELLSQTLILLSELSEWLLLSEW